jgi:hypothetical protein
VPFSHAYLIRLSECWRGKPILEERRKLWPAVLTWAWFLSPERIVEFDRAQQLQILSTATMHAHRMHARRLWEKPMAIYRQCQRLIEHESRDPERFAIYGRLGKELDTLDAETCATFGVEYIDAPPERAAAARSGSTLERERRALESRQAELLELERKRAELDQAELADQARKHAEVSELELELGRQRQQNEGV